MSPLSLLFSLAILSGTVVSKPVISFVLIGDSNTAEDGGWGNGFCGSTVNGIASSLEPDTPCINTGHNGATTDTFVADGWWDISVSNIKAEVAAGQKTYATIQFGNNDMEVVPQESTVQNLAAMVEEIRALGAEPIFVTPIARRIFNDDGTVADTLQPWADIIKQVAQEQSVSHVLDAYAKSLTYLEAIGEEAAHRLDKSPTDLNNNGAIVFGRVVADLMQRNFLLTVPTLPIIMDNVLSFNISHGVPSF